MKTVVNGIEITPQIAEVLASWYRTDSLDPKAKPEIYASWLSGVQDCLTRTLLDIRNVDKKQIKHCLCSVIYVKDELRRFIPESSSEQPIES